MAQRTAQLELNAVSPHDRIFFDNPDILLFKNVFRRHANYSKFISQLQDVNEDTLINAKSDDTLQETTFKIKKNGDLLTNIFLEFEIEYNHPDKDGKEFYTVDHFGNSIVKEAKFLISDNYIIDSYQSFMKQMCKELDVKSHKTFEDDTVRLAVEEGFEHTDTYKLQLSSQESGAKYEPVFIFRKP